MTVKSIIEIRDLVKIYESEHYRHFKSKKARTTPDHDNIMKDFKVQALRGVEMEVFPGDLVAIIGPSGSGKTTLIKLIAGIERPTAGVIRVGEHIVSQVKEGALSRFRQKELGFLWQFPEKNLMLRLDARKNILLPMEISHFGLSRTERSARAKELLEAVGLANKKNQLAANLSGGEAQRLALCVSIANSPKVVLADEPTGELDSDNTIRMINYIKQLNKDFQQTFVVVTHNNLFSNLTDKTYKMRDGMIYGMHRPSQEAAGRTRRDLLGREHFLNMDSLGVIRLPTELIHEVGLTKFVKVVHNKQKGCLEIYPTKN